MTLSAALRSHDPKPLASGVVPFLDLRVPEAERTELLAACETVFKHGRIVNGPEVEQLESAVAARCGKPFGIGVASGTDALIVALRALGIGPGDEVIVPALSFVATANAVKLVGAEPIFCDIGDDLNIDASEVRSHIGHKTKAIIAVHWTGRICAVDHLSMVAQSRGLWLIEDASQAFGATFNGDPAGSRGDVACFSMNAMKTFGALGDAGMIVTGDKKLADECLTLRYAGVKDKEFCHTISGNHRLDTLQAAMLLKRLAHFPKNLSARRAVAEVYSEHLHTYVRTPHQAPHESLGWYTYTIQTNLRDALKEHLTAAGIETKIHHPLLIPQQPAYRSWARGKWSRAANLVKRVLSLPIHEKLSAEEILHVTDSIVGYFR